jgi:hypothetical protein
MKLKGRHGRGKGGGVKGIIEGEYDHSAWYTAMKMSQWPHLLCVTTICDKKVK